MPKSTLWLIKSSAFFSFLASLPAYAQITPDNTLPTDSAVTRQGDTIQINRGTRAGDNLFHSFRDFSVPSNVEAQFNNATDVVNIINRVTGGNYSDIQGIISANGAANLFLINPAGIMFGKNASLNIGGSFFGSTADSVLFPEGEFSATDPENSSTLTINAPIGLNFRDNPQPITNLSFVTDDRGTLDSLDDDYIGLRVPANKTLALLGGDISIKGGFVSTPGGRIEIGSVGENSTVSITPVEKGFDLSYEAVNNFQDINLSAAALVQNIDENPGDIQVQGRNISLIEGAGIGILAEAGQAGNIGIIASESLTLEGNVDLGGFSTQIFNMIERDATAENSQINIETPQLTITDGAQVVTTNDFGSGEGADINITASEIVIARPFFVTEDNPPIPSGILAQVFEEGSGNAGNITIETDTLTLNEGAQINADTFGAGDGGNLSINASESINLTGSIDLSADQRIIPSSLFTNVGEEPTATGNGGDITIDTPRLEVRDGAQIGTTAQNSGNGGVINIDAESILLSGISISPLTKLREQGRSGIAINTQPSFTDEESGETFPTTGDGGILNLTSEKLIIEKGAFISADTFSLGDGGSVNLDVNRLILRDGGQIGAGSLLDNNPVDTERGAGGTLKIDASESIEVTGIGEINGESVASSIFTLAESTGDAGNLTLTTDNLTVSNGGEINASAKEQGAAGNIDITANSIDLTDGEIIASTAAGDGGNITLEIADDLTLEDNSRVSAQATGNANGGNIDIDTRFIVAFPGNSDILASAEQGRGGNINITAKSLFGIAKRPLNNLTNDINASSQVRGLDGNITITSPEAAAIRGATQLQTNVIEAEQTTDKTCAASQATGDSNTLVVRGKGGIPPEPKSPLGADIFSINGKIVGEDGTVSDESELERSQTSSENSVSSQVKPIYTQHGPIYLARGIIKTEDGQVILTPYPQNNTERTPIVSRNCGN